MARVARIERPRWAAIVFAGVAACGGSGDDDAFGVCIPYQPFPGYATCLSSVPQIPIAASMPRSVEAIAPPVSQISLDYFAGCVEVHDQGPCSWCVPHAVTAGMEALACREGATDKLSVPHLWWLGHGRRAFTTCDRGWNFLEAVPLVEQEPLVAASLWPYVADVAVMNASRPPPETLDASAEIGLAGHQEIAQGDVDGVKAAIAAGHPIVVSVNVVRATGWDDWDTAPGRIVAPPAGQGYCSCGDDTCADEHCSEGFHLILLSGYVDDPTGAGGGGHFELLNSWGTGWGNLGYGTLTYEAFRGYTPSPSYALTGLVRSTGTMIAIPGGTFMMGDPGCMVGEVDVDCPYHAVTLSPFDIDLTEVTAAQYQKCVDAGACEASPGSPVVDPDPGAGYAFYDPVGHPNLPATPLSWFDAQAYCAYVGKRLPTEAEWELAARGTDDRLYPWGDVEPTCELAMCDETGDTPGCAASGPYLAPVGSRPAGASPFGVLDMAGNVPEWVADWFDPGYYPTSPVMDPIGPPAEVSDPECIVSCGKSFRGGGYDTVVDEFPLRGYYREHFDPGLNAIGFRCARSRAP